MDMDFNNLQLKFEQNPFMESRDISCALKLFNTCIGVGRVIFPELWALHINRNSEGRNDGKGTYCQEPCTSYTGSVKTIILMAPYYQLTTSMGTKCFPRLRLWESVERSCQISFFFHFVSVIWHPYLTKYLSCFTPPAQITNIWSPCSFLRLTKHETRGMPEHCNMVANYN